MTTMNRTTYEQIIARDIAYLRKEAPNTIERDHIMQVLEWAVRYEYDFIKPQRPNEEGD